MSEDIYKQQEVVINHDKGNIMVSASAGSGKTYSMIKRLIRLITEGKAKVSDVLAVTFTEAAAKEMKEKLAAGISEEISNGNTALAAEVADLPYADVCTIDSFCAKLVRRYFYKADTSPDFGIADPSVAEKLKQEAVDKTFRYFYDNDDAGFLSLSKRFSRSRRDDGFKKIVIDCYEYYSTEVDPDKFIRDNLAVYSEQGLKDIESEFYQIQKNNLELVLIDIDGIEKRLSELTYKDGKGYEQGLNLLKQFRAGIEKALEVRPFDFSLLKTFPKKKFEQSPPEQGLAEKNRLYACIDYVIKEIVPSTEEFYDDYNTFSERYASVKNQTADFYTVLKKYEEYYSELKSEENLLDFNDVERLAQKVLNDPEVAKAVKQKYSFVFVDEYQDVNGIQEDIVTKLSNDNLFTVGDVKQSIYAFRGCRSDFFTEKFNKMHAQNENQAVKLSRNFRSAQKVVDAVNKIFSYSMTEKRYGENYTDGNALVYGGKYDGAEGDFNVYVYSPDKPETEKKDKSEKKRYPFYDVLEQNELLKNAEKSNVPEESRLVAQIIRRKLDEKVYDVEKKVLRNVEYGDIAILSRTGIGNSEEFVNGLSELKIPVTYDGETSILDYYEVAVLVALLKIIRNFNDDVSLAAVMRSPLFGFTDEELAQIALNYHGEREDGFSDALKAANVSDELREKIDGFKNYIQSVRELADFVPAEEILEKVIDEKSYYAFLMTKENGRDRTLRVKFFLSKACEKNYSVSEFISLVEKAPKSFMTGGGDGGNAVKFVTMHSSKGLEYPVVIVRNADKNLDASDDYSKKILSDRKYGFALKYYDDERYLEEYTPLTRLIKEKIKYNFVSEELRLFYVALTRAKYSLNIVLNKNYDFGNIAVSDRYSDFLPIDLIPEKIKELDEFGKTEQPETVLFYKKDEKAERTLKENFSYKYPNSADTVLPLKSSVTQAIKSEEDQAYVQKDFVFSDDVSDVERGNTAHKILELYDFSVMPDVKEFAAKLVKEGVLTEKSVSAVNLDKLSSALSSDVFKLIKNKKLYREQDFIAKIEGRRLTDLDTDSPVVLQGKIDLLAVDGNDAYVIDYKYSGKDGATLKSRYGKQLELYAYAVFKSLNLNVKGKYIVSLLTGETVEV